MNIPCRTSLLWPLAFLALPALAQTAPSTTAPSNANKDAVTVMSEFKIHEKKPVPFTDANMDIPRGINDVQAYYIIGREEIENSGKTDLDEVLRDSLTHTRKVPCDFPRPPPPSPYPRASSRHALGVRPVSRLSTTLKYSTCSNPVRSATR